MAEMMMWYKENGRVVAGCGRLSNAELGLLLRLIQHAWDRQGISQADLPAFAHKMREPMENVELAWEDFLTFADEKNGKYMLPEQWEGAENLAKTRQQRTDAIKSRWKTPNTENKGVSDTARIRPEYETDTNSYEPNTEKRREEKNKKSKVVVAEGGVGETALAGKPQDAGVSVSLSPKKKSEPRQQADLEMWLASLQANPAYQRLDVRTLYAKMCVWCDTHRCKPTQRRFVNWLNREEQPLPAAIAANGYQGGDPDEIIYDPIAKRHRTRGSMNAF